MNALRQRRMSFNAIACLDFWEEVLYREVIAEHPHWPLLRIHRIGGLCVGLRVHAERVVHRHNLETSGYSRKHLWPLGTSSRKVCL